MADAAAPAKLAAGEEKTAAPAEEKKAAPADGEEKKAEKKEVADGEEKKEEKKVPAAEAKKEAKEEEKKDVSVEAKKNAATPSPDEKVEDGEEKKEGKDACGKAGGKAAAKAEGKAEAKKAVAIATGTVANGLSTVLSAYNALSTTNTTAGSALAGIVVTNALLDIDAINTAMVAAGYSISGVAGTNLAGARADIAAMNVKLAEADSPTDAATLKLLLASTLNVTNMLNISNGELATTKAAAGDWKTYSEVNATVTGSVTAGGVTLTAAMSVDAGTGYDFASDDGFDGAKASGVGLDNVSLDLGTGGKIKFDDNAVAHLVDGDDDATGDVSYTNTFGTATATVVMDVNSKDTDAAFVKGVGAKLVHKSAVTTTTAAAAQFSATAAVAHTVQDVQWSAKVSMPVGAGSVYGALDEEGGNAFGGKFGLSGMSVSFDSKLEALDKELKTSRSNTLGVTYVVDTLTLGATYNSIKDGDQWGLSAGYTADGMSINLATDEGSDWSATGSYVLGTGASVKAGVNYTEDAYLGLSFSF